MSELFNEIAASIKKRVVHVIYLHDRSWSMDPISQLTDEGIRNSLETLAKHPDFNVFVQIIEFNDVAKAVFTDFVPAEEAARSYLPSPASGGTSFTQMAKSLGEVQDQLYIRRHPKYNSCYMLISDGVNTDHGHQFEAALEKIKNHKLFRTAIKAAICIGENTKKESLEKFTNNSENVYMVKDDMSILPALIKMVTRSSTDTTDNDSTIPVEVERDENGFVTQIEEIDLDESMS